MHAPSPPPAADELTRRQAWAVALVATLTMAVSYFDRQALSVLAPTVTAELGMSDAEYGWLASAFSIAYLVGTPLSGRIVDRIGARRGLPFAVLAWSIVAALHALAPGYAVLFALRIGLGLAEAPSFPGAAQTIHRVMPVEERPRAFGVLFTGSSFGAMLIPPAATILLGWLGWRAAFVGTALVGLAWIPLWLFVTRPAAARARLDATDAEAPATHGAPAAPDAPREGPASTATLDVLRRPAVLRAVILVVACAPALSFVFLWASKYLVATFGLTTKDVGAYLWLPPLCLDLGSVLFGDLAARRRKLLPTGASDRLLVAAAAALTLAIAALPLAGSPWSAVLVAGLTMAGGGALYAILTSDMLSRVPSNIVSQAGGMTAAAQSLAYVLASPLIGWSVDRFHGYAPALVALAVWIVPGALVWLLWDPTAAPRGTGLRGPAAG